MELVLLSSKPALSEQSREGKQSWRVQLRRNAAECPTESQEAEDGHQQMRAHPLLSSEQGLEDGESF